MNEFIRGFLDNDSTFGRLMNKCYIIIAANITFMIFSIPFFTIGPGFIALYHVMLRALREDYDINPFKEFWKGFKSNFKQGMVIWILAILFAIVILGDVQICQQAGGFIGMFRYPLYMMGLIGLILFLFVLPVTAAFADDIKGLFRNAFYFAAKKPFKLLVILFFDVFPLYLTYTDPQYMPLYGFLWITCGFGLVSMLGAALLLPEFKPFLDKDHPHDEGDYDDFDEAKMMEDLRKMDGL
ncbi:MAG: DUF624 domain-containing protein [Firmicutes bacterium]|nr:DUF624 domain-containing protein [Bacillota bacterium]